MEKIALLDYSKARPRNEPWRVRWYRRRSPSVITSASPAPIIVPADVGSTDANNAIAMGIPAVAVGAAMEHLPHRLEEFAEAGSIVPGVKSLIALAVALTSH